MASLRGRPRVFDHLAVVRQAPRGNPLHLAYQAWNRQLGRMPGQIRIRVRCVLHKTPWFDYLMVSQEDSGLSPESKKLLKEVKTPVHLQVFVTPT